MRWRIASGPKSRAGGLFNRLFFKVQNITRIPDHCVAGEGDTTVFLLHGAYGSKDYFRELIASLVGAGLRVVAWDAPGYGLSKLPAQPLSIEYMAEAAARLVDQEATATNVVLGHSMGGIIAPLVGVLRPKTVHGVVVSATVGSFSQKSEADRKTFLAERIDPLKAGKTFRETAKAVVDSMFAPTSRGPRVDMVREVALSTASETFIQAIGAIVNYRGEDTLVQLKAPTLLLAGAHDKVGRPEGMRKIQAEFVPHAQMEILPDSGHYAFAEEPEAFNRHLLAFVEQVRRR